MIERSDTLVVGSGIAGLLFALKMAKRRLCHRLDQGGPQQVEHPLGSGRHRSSVA